MDTEAIALHICPGCDDCVASGALLCAGCQRLERALLEEMEERRKDEEMRAAVLGDARRLRAEKELELRRAGTVRRRDWTDGVWAIGAAAFCVSALAWLELQQRWRALLEGNDGR